MTTNETDRPIINYDSRGVRVETSTEGATLIIVPTRRNFLAFALFWAVRPVGMHPIMILVSPLTFSIAVVVFLLAKKATPRAVIRITRDEIVLETTEDYALGDRVDTLRWQRGRVTEFRANRFGAGLYFRIAGEVNMDLLKDLPPGWIQQIDAALRVAMEKTT